MAYDNAVYGMKFRKWFGLGKGHGAEGAGYGDGAAADSMPGYRLGSGTNTLIASWYPMQPIKITKFGVRVIVAVDTAPCGTDTRSYNPFWIGKAGLPMGSIASAIASLHLEGAQTAGYIGSNPTMNSNIQAVVAPGEYVTFKQATIRRTFASMEASSVTGVVAFFVDYTPQYSSVSDGYWTD